MLNPPEGHEHAGENDEGQDEIRDRPCDHDRGPVPQRLTRQRQRAIDRRIGVGALADAGGVGVAVKLDVSAERQRANPPPRAAGVDPSEQLRAEAEGKRVDFDAAPSADQIVPELVHRDDQAEDEDERDDVPSEPGQEVGDRVHSRHLRRLQLQLPVGERPAGDGYRTVSKMAQVRAYAKRLAVRSVAIW